MGEINDEKSSDLTISGQIYSFIKKLCGRGQVGAGGFYKRQSDQKEFLIKKDPPGICMVESLVVPYIPDPVTIKDDDTVSDSSSNGGDLIEKFLQNLRENPEEVPIVQADIGCSPDGTVYSIQPKFEAKNTDERVMGLDEFLLGRKRWPFSPVSYEYCFQSRIKEKLATLSPEVKMQLAYAIYLSQLNGDESLHTGQFMISVKDKSSNSRELEVTSVKRVDFGALGRYALQRVYSKDFNLQHTSASYSTSGQMKKDYVAYLLQDDEIKKYLLEFWKKTDAAKATEAITTRYQEQLSKVTGQELKTQVQVYNIFAKDLPPSINESVRESDIASTIKHATGCRIEQYKSKAEEDQNLLQYSNESESLGRGRQSGL